MVREGLLYAERGMFPEALLAGHSVLARLKQIEGDRVGALAEADAGERIAKAWGVPRFVRLAAAQRARLLLLQGDRETAVHWADDYRRSPHNEPRDFRDYEDLTLARVLLAQGDGREALAVVERLLEVAPPAGRIGSVIEALVVASLAHWQLGDDAGASLSLSQALALAQPEKYVRVFVDEGAPMAALLREMPPRLGHHQAPVDLRLSADYVDTILTALGQSPADVDRPCPGPPLSLLEELPEPLTAREKEVLRLIADGLSNQAVADCLVISLATLKTHINHLYSKLGAASRVQAVARARERQILD